MTREEAMDLLDTLIGMVEDSRNSDYDTAFKMGIKALEQEPRWIPVSERLPEENGQYLVTVKNLTGYEQLSNNVFECEFFEKDWIFKGWKDNKVIAWMPLPKPYKAESEEI